MKPAKFSLGLFTATPGVLETLPISEILSLALDRHMCGDWGNLDEHDKKQNENALMYGGRLFSSYNTEHGKVWIITEADRSSTTCLLPSEY